MFNIGDLVVELIFGRSWYEKNPWMTGGEIGIIVEINDNETYDVYWPDKKITQMTKDLIGKPCA
tara:strand:+ start:170 stop:361 length:192 start_codon:yes stop_codon:yes gene_type:complete